LGIVVRGEQGAVSEELVIGINEYRKGRMSVGNWYRRRAEGGKRGAGYWNKRV